MTEPNITHSHETQNEAQTPAPRAGKSGGLKKQQLLYIGFIILLIAIGTGGYVQQNGKIKSLSNDVSHLKTDKDSLAKDKQNLQDKNKKLSSSLKVLQGQISADKTTVDSNKSKGSSDSPAAEPDTKLTVNSVKNVSGSAFAKAGYTPPIGDFKAVYLTMTNQSKQQQSYTAFQFTAVTKDGSVLQPSQFAPTESQGLWNNSTLAAGESQDIVLLFPQNQDIVVLTHAFESGSPVSVSLPAAQ